MEKTKKYAIWSALILLVYAAGVIFFVTIPAFASRALEGKKEIMIVTLIPFAAMIFAFVLLFSKRFDHVFEKLPAQFLNLFFAIYFAAILVICPLALYTERIHKIEMCSTVWNIAWPVSLGISVLITVLLFRYGKHRADFTGQLIFLCVLTFPVAYFLPVLIFKLIAFQANCVM